MPIDQQRLNGLKKIAREIRKDVITMLARAGSGHTGGSLSAVEIMVSLFFHKMRFAPDDSDSDKFVLSKGHACPTLYAIFIKKGLYPPETLYTLRKLGSPFQGHPCRLKTRGIDIPTGSLGQGLSAGIGIALGARINKKDYRVYVLLGDGECQEGQVWEAAMCAAHYKLDNLCAIIDYNQMQIDGYVYDVINPEPFMKKWEAMRWNAYKIDGHDFRELINALDDAEKIKQKPTVIIAKTIKGKGISFMENNLEWHGKAPTLEEAEMALKELDSQDINFSQK